MSMIGKTLGSFECTALLGKGGMGEVYKAKDQKLGRDVAIKVLPEEFAKDADRVARFQREAKLLASLNHPNIAAIYGLEESDGTHFLVLELIEGDTLADRVRSGPIPVEESLKLALQIAEALEAAHEKGVIHRDLKPANIKVTPDGKVKVLDFGLAKAFAGDQAEVNLSHSPTLSEAATLQGVILGTAAYMSPEQARGKQVHKRADVWAFGCVLYEMLAGRAAFSGRDVTDILAAVIRAEPEWKSLPANLHWRLREVLERCLEKEAKDRYGSINDARVDVQRVLKDPSGVFVQSVSTEKPQTTVRIILLWVAAALVLGGIIAGVAVWFIRSPQSPTVMRFDYELPEGQRFISNNPSHLAISPDGKQFVYSTPNGLYLRSVNELAAKLIPGTEGVSLEPFYSPDGQWIGYWSYPDRKLKKISVNGGVAVVICDAPLAAGVTWCKDGTILYGQVPGDIMQVSADGGTPKSIIKPESIGAAYPQLLPDGKSILYTDASVSQTEIVVQSLESGERKELFTGVGAQYIPTGHLVYSLSNDNNAYAVPFNLDKLEVTGGAFPIIQGIYGSGATSHAVSDTGTLIYIPGVNVPASISQRTLVWVDRDGKEESLMAEPQAYSHPRISPDGTRVALSIGGDKNTNIWIWDLARKAFTRLTFDETADLFPLWTPDGKRIAFYEAGAGKWGIYSKAADGTGKIELWGSIPFGAIFLPSSWSSEGKDLLSEVLSYEEWAKGIDSETMTAASAQAAEALSNLITGRAQLDISGIQSYVGVLPMGGEQEGKALLKDKFLIVNPQLSPDGRWVAYSSSESGQMDIYVRPFPDVDSGKWQVSTGGGAEPRWSPNGEEMFYRDGDAMMAVPIRTEPSFEREIPEKLFEGSYYRLLGHMWDLSPDGKRFLMIKPVINAEREPVTEAPRKINIVLNWFEELKERVPLD
jgi:serine/threonine protein kinase